MDKNEAINIVKKYKELLEKNFTFEKVFLYGSYAKNNFSDESDIDVAIVARDIQEDFFTTNPLLWKLRRSIDDRIEPILIDANNDPAGFLDEIQKTGIEIN
jgi:predicted nucleotidyltransferase